VATLIAAPRKASRKNPTWCLLFLEHLDEFAILAWYLVADNRLVEDTILGTMAHLDEIPFDASTPLLAYNQAREILITQAIAILRLNKTETDSDEAYASSLIELPDLLRIAFMLKLVLRTSEVETAKFLGVKPSKVRQLVQLAIERLSLRAPSSVLTGCYDA
jgi:DNA-directed RNA polymerase specialized sigma24 family protein